MIKNFSVLKELTPWTKNFQDNQDLPIVTESSVIGLRQLERFIKKAKKECAGFNGLRIYFIRYDSKTDKLKRGIPHIMKIKNSEFSQVSLAIVPVKEFNSKSLSGKDFSKGDKILTLAFCHPSLDKPGKRIGTGHCPPICKR